MRSDAIVERATSAATVTHEVPAGFRSRFVSAGYRARDFFPHRIRYLAPCGPDGAFLAHDIMLEIERSAGVPASYMVVGTLMRDVRDRIELDGGQWRGTHAGGHAIGFHSYDYSSGGPQVAPCRRVDYRLKGYRAPQSRLTPELTDERLCRYNFEWLASSSRSLGFRNPRFWEPGRQDPDSP